MIKDYYNILGINRDSDNKEIKKKYRELCLKYHPDKNNNIDDDKIKDINEAYHILYDKKERKKYDIRYLFIEYEYIEYIELSDDDIEIILNIYNRFTDTNEYKLLKLLYKCLPRDIFKKKEKQIVKSHKRIDILELYHDETINFIISYNDYKGKNLKIIYIISQCGIYYLYLRDFRNSININNKNCKLIINFIINGI